MAGNEFAFGLDLAVNPAISDPKAAAAAQNLARDSGKLTASGLPIRERGAREFVGLAMRLAVYRGGVRPDTVGGRRAAYLGSVGAGFNLEAIMRGALDESVLRYLRYRLYDIGPSSRGVGTASRNPRLLFDSDQLVQGSNSPAAKRDETESLIRILPMEVGGRSWEIHFSAPKERFVGDLDRYYPWIILAGGVLLSFLLFGVLRSLSSSRGRALKIAAQMTRDLRQTEERFRLIAENASDVITLWDGEGRRVYVNRAYERLFGDRSAIVGEDPFMYIHPEDRDRLREEVQATVRGGEQSSSEFRLVLPSGEVRYIESHRSAVRDSNGKVAHVVAVSRDVTERRHNDEALRLRELQLVEAQAIANLGIWVRDLRSNQSTWSEQLFKIFGLDRDQVRPSREAFLSCVHAEDRERVTKLGDALQEGGPAMFETHFRIVRKDGSVRPLESRIYVNRDPSGQAVRVVGVCQDVTEKKRTEERAKASEERFRMMVENVRDYAIYMLDPKGYVTSWNLGAERINGYKADEVIGRHYSRFFLPEQAARGDPGMQLEFASIQGRYESEGWRVRKDGSHLWAHIIVTPLLDEVGNRRGYSEITHDITERKRAEEDLYSYADRLRATSRRLVEVQEAERRMLAGELHDRVGQSLTALGLNLSIIASSLPAKRYPELAARLEDSHVLVEGTIDAMRNVMAELRPQALDDYGLAAALRSLAAGFSRLTGIQVAFDGDAPEGTLPKPVDLAMFRIAQEALNNVAKHAGANRVEIAFRRENGRAALSVSDDGVGFDSKRPGSTQSGWGLLIMRERAEAVGAEFSLKADPNAGVQVLVEYRIGSGGGLT